MKKKNKSKLKQPDKPVKPFIKASPKTDKFYQDTMDNISDGVYRLNVNGYFTFVNKAITERSGMSREQFYASHFLDILEPEYHDVAQKNFKRVIKGQNGIPYELKYRGANGQVMIVEVSSSPIYEAQKVLGLLGISRDITKRRQTENSLEESELRFRLAAESCADLIWEWDIITGELKWFGPIDKLLGYEVGEFPRTIDAWEGIIHNDDHNRVMAQLDRHLEDGTPYFEEYRVLRRDGTILYWGDRGTAVRYAEAKPSKMVGAVTDITELKLAEKALRKSEEKYRAILENASDAILLTDEKGNIVEANRNAEELMGYTREELLQMNNSKLHPKPVLERTMKAFKTIVKEGHGFLHDGVIIKKDGKIVSVDITGSVIEYSGEKIVQGSFRDVSEQKRSKDTLQKLVSRRTAELSRRNEQLMMEINQRKRAEATLRKKGQELRLQSEKLSELNSALKVLLKQREDDKIELENKVMANVKGLLLPYLDELKKGQLDARSKVQVSILETNLNNIISPFTHRLSSKYSGFTPREIQVANLIRQGNSTKDIAEYLQISKSAINLYRNKIRYKLGILTKKINLRSHLMSFS